MMKKTHCVWCATDWPTLRPCCVADLDNLIARDYLARNVDITGFMSSSQMALIARDFAVPEIGDPPWMDDSRSKIEPEEDTE